VLAAIPANDDIRRKSASYEIIGRPGTQWAPLFEELATNVAEAPPVRPKPADAGPAAGPVLGRVTGRDFKMEPATLFDMVGKTEIVKPTLEVVYDEA
jgi:chlorophyllide a reductase subunit X